MAGEARNARTPAEGVGGLGNGLGNASVSALIGAALALAAALTIFKGFELYAADLRISKQATAPSRTDLAVIAIDDAALAASPFQSPVDRKVLASTVDQLNRLGARTIALDILLDRPSFPADDTRLASALTASRAPVILGVDPGGQAGAIACGSSAQLQTASETGAPAAAPSSILPEFAAHARASLAICIEGDGVVRHLPNALTEFPGLAESLGAGPARTIRNDGRPIDFRLAPGDIPTVPVYSASTLELMPDGWLAGRAVVVGLVTPFSGDWVETPLRLSGAHVPTEPVAQMPKGKLPGVMIHALSAATLIDGRQGLALDWTLGAILALAGAACGAAFGIWSTHWWVRALSATAVIAIVLGIAAISGPALGRLMPMTPFPVGLTLAAGLTAGAEAQR
jgi:CHASE2 domain-containing sensor protein